MRKATFLLVSFTLGMIMIAAFVTAGLLTNMLWLYLPALWISMLLLVIFLGLYFKTYRLIMTRIGTVSTRLNEIKLLQERRYEQLARRLDNLTQSGQSSIPQLSDLEHTIARVERAERRILGKLENILLDNDRRHRTTHHLGSNCSDHRAQQ